MRRTVTHSIMVFGLGVSCAASVSMGQVNLSLEPANISVAPGAAFELQLWARSDAPQPQSLDGAEVVLQWDAPAVVLNGHSDDGAPYTWSVSEFMSATPRNDTWDDGDALYTCLAPLTAPSPQTDLLITTFQFTASQSSGVAAIRIPTNCETDVAGGGVSVLGTTSGATVRVGFGSSQGGGATGGNAGSEPPDDGNEEPPDDTAEPAPGDDNEPAPGSDEEIVVPTPENGPPPSSGGESPGSDEGREFTRPVLFTLCGVGVVEGIVMCFAGLCLFMARVNSWQAGRGSRSRVRAPRPLWRN